MILSHDTSREWRSVRRPSNEGLYRKIRWRTCIVWGWNRYPRFWRRWTYMTLGLVGTHRKVPGHYQRTLKFGVSSLWRGRSGEDQFYVKKDRFPIVDLYLKIDVKNWHWLTPTTSGLPFYRDISIWTDNHRLRHIYVVKECKHWNTKDNGDKITRRVVGYSIVVSNHRGKTCTLWVRLHQLNGFLHHDLLLGSYKKSGL